MKHARTDYDSRIQDSAGLIPDDEPVLLIRGQDICAEATGLAWIEEAQERGVDPAVIESVRAHLDEIRDWQMNGGEGARRTCQRSPMRAGGS